MANDELIAALETALRKLNPLGPAAATLRAHIADIKAGGERTKVVAYLEAEGITRLSMEEGWWDTSFGVAYGQTVLVAIASGAHEVTE